MKRQLKENVKSVINFTLCFLIGNYVVGQQFNPGFEYSNTNPAGWSVYSTSGPLGSTSITATSRSGSRAILVNYYDGVGTTKYQHDGYSVTVPNSGGPYYVHVIGWLSSTNTYGDDRVALGIRRITGTVLESANSPANVTTAYVRNTRTWPSATADTYVPVFIGNCAATSATNTNCRGDDFIIYYSTQANPDLSNPNSPSSLCVNASGSDNILTWTDGADNATNTSSIDGTLVLRAPAGTALPTVLDQAYYSSNSSIGPNMIGAWSVILNGTSSGTYTDAGAAGQPFVYAVYMRDKAYNYSATPATFTTANAGPDQVLACSVFNTTLSATAASGGVWSLQSGGGTIANLTLANSTVSSIPNGLNTYKWTVSNGGCSTYDFVNVSVASTTPSLPIISSPANGSTISPAPVNLIWTNGGGAVSYTVSTGTSSPPGMTSPSQTSTNFGMGALSSGTTYYWRVNATNACGTTTGTIWNFSTFPEFSASASGTEGSCGTGWDSGNTWTGFVKNITVGSPTNLPTPLGTGSGQYVLNEVEVELGDDACEKDLSNYFFRLTAPDNTTFIDFFPTSGLTTSNNVKWIKIKFRDHSALEMVNEYTSIIQDQYYPFSIGYYGIETVDGFKTVFNGVNPNGVWKFAIKENTSDEISFKKVTLKFGPKLIVQDLTSVDNNNCSNMQCIDTRAIVVGTNSGFTANDPVFSNVIASAMNPCDWNGANNNSAWFYFTATQTTSNITISGMKPIGTTDNFSTQPIIFGYPGACVLPSGSSVPAGGCPNDNSVNNAIYETSGARPSGDAYVNGITANTEFNLSGLTPGQRYILYIDGNGGTASPFYIDGLTGMQTCDNVILPLPIELLSFNAVLQNKTAQISWYTASERNNDYFIVERSHDGIEWEFLEKVKGAGSSTELLSYITYDYHPYRGVGYYRLKQIDYDGKSSYSEIRSVYNTDDLMILPNPSAGIFGVGGMPEHQENSILVMDITGQILEQYTTEEESYQLDLTQRSAGVYIVIINGLESIKIVKQ